MRNDPYKLRRYTQQLLIQIEDAVENLKTRVHEMNTSLIITQGDEDKITPVKGTEDFFSTIRYEDKKLIRLKGIYHEFFEDDEKDSIIQIFLDWIETKKD